MPPAISVIVPLFNKRPYVGRCLASIRRQTVAPLEVIVVDDGSTDRGGEAVAARADRRFRLIVQQNQGAAAARNRGAAEARGDLVAFLDADDEWHPGFLGAVSALAERYPEAGLFATGIRRRKDGEPDRETTLACQEGGAFLVDDYLERVQEGDFITSSSVALRRSCFAAAGGFPAGLSMGEDIDLWARASLLFPFAFDTRVLATYHSEAAGRSFERHRKSPPYPQVVRTLRGLLSEGRIPAEKAAAVRECIEFRLLQYAYWLLDLRRRKDLTGLLASERFTTPRYRGEASLLRAGVRLLPLRAVFAIRYKPERIKAWWSGSAGEWTGRRVISRYLFEASEPAAGGGLTVGMA